jgi:DMSO/TMAO reductase YedYZ heme-binding membrane subunit
MTRAPGERITAGAHATAVAALAITLPLGAGMATALAVGSTVHSKFFPWISSRALGVAAYVSLTALVALGLWLRHPWRFKVRLGHAESMLRTHATLAVATVALVIAHLSFLATDRYAGVGWSGALIPGLSHYRTLGVGLGVAALYLMAAISLTARFAGRRGTRHWLGVHRLALLTFAATWFHGVLSGIDVVVLRPLYATTGALIAALCVTRLFARREAREAVPLESDAARLHDLVRSA